MKVEQIEEWKLGLEIDLLKMKVEQVEEQKLSLKIDLQKVKVEQVEELDPERWGQEGCLQKKRI